MCRLRYVNETFATLLIACGYKSINEVKNADYEQLHSKINTLNNEVNLYGCAMGMKDMQFLVESVPASLEKMEF